MKEKVLTMHLNQSKYNPKYVLIHDVARPIISSEVIEKLVSYSKQEFFV